MHATANNNVMHAKPGLRVVLKWMIAASGSVINNVMHAKPGLRVVLKWMIAASGSVIAAVMCLRLPQVP